MALEPTYTAYQVAHELHVSYSTVMRLLRKRTMRAVKVGRAWRVRESELKRVLGLDPEGREEQHDRHDD